jgi:hypothetical protein
MNPDLNLDCASPEDVPAALRAAAIKFREATSDLQAAWGDKSAGVIWSRFATILEAAATKCDAAIDKI